MVGTRNYLSTAVHMNYKRKVHAGIYYDCGGKPNDINSNC